MMSTGGRERERENLIRLVILALLRLSHVCTHRHNGNL